MRATSIEQAVRDAIAGRVASRGHSTPDDLVFVRADMEESQLRIKRVMSDFRVGKKAAKATVRKMRHSAVFKSICNSYQVNVSSIPPRDGVPEMVHLIIKRVDRQTIRDWRVLQAIKNKLLSPKHEAVELFPSEDRKVDGANSYHLFALADPAHRFPFGFEERSVTNSPGGQAVQRPLDDPEGQATETSLSALLMDPAWDTLSAAEQCGRLALAADALTRHERKPTAWVARSPTGSVLHMSLRDGWTVDAVTHEASGDGDVG